MFILGAFVFKMYVWVFVFFMADFFRYENHDKCKIMMAE